MLIIMNKNESKTAKHFSQVQNMYKYSSEGCSVQGISASRYRNTIWAGNEHYKLWGMM